MNKFLIVICLFIVFVFVFFLDKFIGINIVYVEKFNFLYVKWGKIVMKKIVEKYFLVKIYDYLYVK